MGVGVLGFGVSGIWGPKPYTLNLRIVGPGVQGLTVWSFGASRADPKNWC